MAPNNSERIKDLLQGTHREGKAKIAVLGGDAREMPLIEALLSEFKVACFARPESLTPKGTIRCETITEVLYGADGVILPMPGLKNDGSLFSKMEEPVCLYEEDFSSLKPGTIVLVGAASNLLRGIAQKYSLDLMPLVETDEIAIPNAIPTAEGAIALAISESEITLDGSISMILGYGRVGQALAKRLHALGSRVVIANRGEERAALAEEAGFDVIPWGVWSNIAPKVEYLFNTVPTPLLTAGIIETLKKEVLILDLASSPGGTDFAAAKEQGIKAILAAGLPGRYAPVTAGKILMNVYPGKLREKLKK